MEASFPFKTPSECKPLRRNTECQGQHCQLRCGETATTAHSRGLVGPRCFTFLSMESSAPTSGRQVQFKGRTSITEVSVTLGNARSRPWS